MPTPRVAGGERTNHARNPGRRSGNAVKEERDPLRATPRQSNVWGIYEREATPHLDKLQMCLLCSPALGTPKKPEGMSMEVEGMGIPSEVEGDGWG
jgi:hypothetical protein